ncbi:hypothetical protein ISN45_At04g008210 [Arabidopsis thaliana x Arabidopsis arenosa]|uniref:Glabrous enhancer-binding protein-like C-terminal domain-containing protein n=1 Tax=Arabidopsis thaliana x Arabidopsis arenosa TaxID=1240361 RepID=A0A8T2DTJ4_9BRAS|nr:hypothetical protein ISN45_At04g008210 [Arabidopsis thaliana x Arabidopsis arenosa]
MVKNKQLQPLVTSSTSHLWRRSRWKSSHQLRRINENSDWFERSFVGGAFKELDSGVDEETWKKNWSLVPVKKRNRIEEKVKSVQADELKTMWEKIDVVHEARSLMAKYV